MKKKVEKVEKVETAKKIALTQMQVQNFKLRSDIISHHQHTVLLLNNELNQYIVECAKTLGINPNDIIDDWDFNMKEMCFIKKEKAKLKSVK